MKEKDRRKKNQRQKIKRAGRIEEREKKDLKIYSPGGKLIYVAKEGFCFDYGELLRQEKYKHRRY
jgi:hypothetical protein